MKRVVFRRGAMALWVGMAMLAWGRPARAGEGCPVVLTPADTDASWRAATLAAERRLATETDAPRDCRSVAIEVQREGNALLTFTTADGRTASRILHAPEDILPVLEALLVTLPSEPAPAQAAPPPPAAATSLPRAPAPPAPTPRAPVVPSMKPEARPPPPPPRFLIGASVGGRLGLDEPVLSPAVILRATITLSSWELGVRGEWDPLYTRLVDKNPDGFKMYSLSVNLLAGRRDVLRRVEIPYGVLMGLTGVHEGANLDPTSKSAVAIETIEPRLGAYAGIASPRDAKLRFSLGLAFDVALSGLRDAGTAEKGLPTLPRFGLGLSLGVEVAP